MGRSSAASPIAIILLFFLAPFLNQTNFAESFPAIPNHFPEETTSSRAVPPEYSEKTSSCKKSPMQCSSICQTDLLAEARAAELEKYSRKTRKDADKAAQKAASIEKQVNKKLRQLSSSRNTSSSGSENPRANAFWKIVGIVPRLFVSHEARTRADEQEKQAGKYGRNPLPDSAGQNALQLQLELQMALKTAEDAQKVAAEAKSEADRARTHADSVRQSYKNCLSGKELQINSP